MQEQESRYEKNVRLIPEIMFIVESVITGIRAELSPNPKVRASGAGFHTTKFGVFCMPEPDGRFHIYYEGMASEDGGEIQQKILFSEYNEGKTANDVANAVFTLYMRMAFMFGEQLATNILVAERNKNGGKLPPYKDMRDTLIAARRELMKY